MCSIFQLFSFFVLAFIHSLQSQTPIGSSSLTHCLEITSCLFVKIKNKKDFGWSADSQTGQLKEAINLVAFVKGLRQQLVLLMQSCHMSPCHME